MTDSIVFAFRAANGMFMKRGISSPVDVIAKAMDPRTNMVRAMEFSNNGEMLVYCDSERTVCVDTSTGTELFAHQIPKTTRILFSPDDRLLVTYEPYVIYGSRIDEDGNQKVPNPNLRFFDTADGSLLTTLIQKNQSSWQPMFTEDGQTFVLVENSEIHFFDSKKLERFNRKGVIRGVETLSVSPGLDPVLAAFVPSKSSPNMISLRNFHGDLSTIHQKSTFNADKVTFQWNSKGNACLAVASVEVDKSNQSYYGNNSVFLMTKSSDIAAVSLSKKGPVHNVKWSPLGTQFAICYGFMPSKVTIFNFKASIIWDMEEGYRNEIYYNQFGNLISVCGFGNISSGKINIYDVEQRKEVVSMEVPDTINFEWAPDGQHYLTATTSPRLRIDNNYRIWKYTGEQLYEQHMKEITENGTKDIELAQICFKPAPGKFACFKAKKLSDQDKMELAAKRVSNDTHPAGSLKKAGIVSSNSVYVPPALRNAGANKPSSASKPLGKELTESEKRARVLRKKLKEVEALKTRQSAGDVLEKNQLAKLETFDKLKAELDEIRSKMET